jgi:hypothetical protein
MKWLVLALLLLSGCTETPPKEVSPTVEQLFREEKACRAISHFVGLPMIEYGKVFGDWSCLLKRERGNPLIIFREELDAMNRLIAIKNRLSN